MVTDDDGNVILAGCAKQILEVYGWCAKEHHPVVIRQAFQVLFDHMKMDLATKGWHEVNAFLPKEIALAFGRKLIRFGWAKNLVSYYLKF